MKRAIILMLISVVSSTMLYGQTYEEWIDRYQTQLKNDSLAAAEQSLLAALKLESTGKQAGYIWSNLGTLQRNLGKYEQAIDSYNKALLMLPHSITIHMNRAALYSELNRFEQAIQDYSDIILIDPDYETAYYLRGLARIEAGDTLAAKQDFEIILKKNKSSALGRIGTATLLNATGRYREAAEIYSEVIRFNPRKAAFYLNRSESYLMDKKPGKALKDINTAIEIDPTNPVFYYMRGKIKNALFEPESAKTDFAKALQLGLDPRLLNETGEKK